MTTTPIPAAVDTAATERIGPLTPAEWAALRLRDDTGADLLACCGITSAFRDAVFELLRMGGDQAVARLFRREWQAMADHGLPDGEGGRLLRLLGAYYWPEVPHATDQAVAALAALRAIIDDNAQADHATAALDGLSRDDVYGIKWWAEQLIAVVENKFDSMPEE